MSKHRILLVEDCRPDVLLVERALTQAGLDYELTVAEDGEQARNLVTAGGAASRYDLVLMDLNLPKIEGAELIRLLREIAGQSAIPIVVISSSNSPADQARLAQLGVDAYFQKTSDLEEFMRLGPLVRRVLG